MGQRSTICTYQMLDQGSGQYHSHFLPDQGFLSGNLINYADRSMNPPLSASRNNADHDFHQFRGHHDVSILYGSQYNNMQNQHYLPNTDMGSTVQSNFYSPCMPSSSGGIYSASQNNGATDTSLSSIATDYRSLETIIDEYGRHNYLVDSGRGTCKRKNLDVVPGNYYHVNGLASSGFSSHPSVTSGQPQWEERYETGINFLGAATFDPPAYQGNSIRPTIEGSNRSVRSRSSGINHHHEPALVHHHNSVYQGSNMGHSFQPTSNAWLAHCASNAGGGNYWNNNQAMTYPQGRCLGSSSVHGYQETSTNPNAALFLHPLAVPNFQQHLPPMPNMHVPSYTQVTAPPYHYHPSNTMPPGSINPYQTCLSSGFSLPLFTSDAEVIYRMPWMLSQATPEANSGSLRILPQEDVAFMELSEFSGAESVIDQHRDMRLDIDDMSYEELLELEEQIGDVNTGLTEEFILRHLQRSMHVRYLTSSRLDRSSGLLQENETCSICQVEYENNERIGTLDCGHKYHAECIKEWLLIKNLCPICKTSALVIDKRDG